MSPPRVLPAWNSGKDSAWSLHVLRQAAGRVDPRHVPAAPAGRRWDRALLAELPPAADTCGENGEFHTFVSAGPMFAAPLAVRTGEVATRDGFTCADVLPA
jgi:diphthamide synthase (EF-2-diphthine--ammonia ligase)